MASAAVRRAARVHQGGQSASASAGAGLEKIGNIVVVLQENHTFDNYFGTFPGADGTSGRSICIPGQPGSKNCIAPFHSSTLTPADMSHNWASAHSDYNSGKMDGFVYSEGSRQTMCYFDGGDLPRYWKAAREYVLCERYFTSVMSESAPNHLYLVAGTSGGIRDDRVPSGLTFPPVFEQLDSMGISWKVYGFTRWYESFEYVQGSGSASARFATAAEFDSDVQGGRLPEVSWIVGAPGGDEHPPKNVAAGQDSVADDIVNKLGTSDYWKGLALFITWDDYGGFYDHVPPPQVDPFGYGFRVPCLVVSPYSQQGKLDRELNDHTSILKFIETRHGLSPLSTRDASANPMLEAFDFSAVPRAFTPI